MSRRSIPLGAAVRELSTGRVGCTVKVPRYLKRRGYLSVLFEGSRPSQWVNVRGARVEYLARRFEDWLSWRDRSPVTPADPNQKELL